MSDFSQKLTSGDIENGIANVIIEIPTGSKNKIEWNSESDTMQLDRVQDCAEPANYGFIPNTINDDGDGLDVIIINDKPLLTETFLKTRIIGVIKFEDEGLGDDKIVVVPEGATGLYAGISNIDDIDKTKLDEIFYYLVHSKDFIGKGLTSIKGLGDKECAKKIIYKSIERFDKINKN